MTRFRRGLCEALNVRQVSRKIQQRSMGVEARVPGGRGGPRHEGPRAWWGALARPRSREEA